MAPDVRAMHQWLHPFVPNLPGGVLLDIGCGTGEDLRMLATSKPSLGRLIGIDSREAPIQTAQEIQGDARLQFECLDVSKGLLFADASIDIIYSVNTLECITDKQAFLAECARVLKSGGHIVMGHWDWDTQTFDGEDRALIRKIVQSFNDWKQAWMDDIDPWMGRRLWPTFQRSGLFKGEIQTYTLTNTQFAPSTFSWQQANAFEALVRRGVISRDEYKTFLDGVARQEEKNEFFFSLNLYAFIGQKIE